MTAAPSPPWLTVVTVVKDDPVGLERTLSSLVFQDLEGVEWVVIDGSADSVQALVEHSPVPNTTYRWVEPAGVYPAMNAGLTEASGDYIHFLNAGDEFASEDAVRAIRGALRVSPVWTYGQVCFVSEDGRRVTPPPFDYAEERSRLFARGRFPPHQGTVARTRIVRDFGGFDTRYRIAADYALALRLACLEDPVEIPDVIAVFVEGGLSTRRWRASLHEFHRARCEILQPRGVNAVRERIDTAGQWVRMSLARALQR